MIGEYVQVFNRSALPITITKDGRQYTLKPGLGHLRSDLILLGKNQNPIMGTENHGSTVTESYLSVVAEDPAKQIDPLDSLDLETMKLLPEERLDRNTMAPERQKTTRVKRGDFPKGRVGVEQPTSGMHEPGQKF